MEARPRIRFLSFPNLAKRFGNTACSQNSVSRQPLSQPPPPMARIIQFGSSPRRVPEASRVQAAIAMIENVHRSALRSRSAPRMASRSIGAAG